ncbi:hypothetical protein DEU40_10812 [Chryseobacterium sp. AG844]|nr:hypothetical protein DEU40_10812 [Chryseobacterium sp. AG844]
MVIYSIGIKVYFLVQHQLKIQGTNYEKNKTIIDILLLILVVLYIGYRISLYWNYNVNKEKNRLRPGIKELKKNKCYNNIGTNKIQSYENEKFFPVIGFSNLFISKI